MIRIVRFSEDGFIPKEQHFHRKYVANRTNLVDNIDEMANGIFCFLYGEPSGYVKHLLLDHLTKEQKESYKWWSALLPYDTLVWQDNIFEKDKMLELYHFNRNDDVYIPAINLHNLTNVEIYKEDY